MGKINVTGNNRVDALDEKLSQDLSGATFKLVRVTRRCRLDEQGGAGHSGRREQSVTPACPLPPPLPPQAHWRNNNQVHEFCGRFSVCWQAPGHARLCVWQKMTLELET